MYYNNKLRFRVRNWEFLFSSITAKLENRFFFREFLCQSSSPIPFFFLSFFFCFSSFLVSIKLAAQSWCQEDDYIVYVKEVKKKKEKKEVLFFVGYSITQHAYGKVPPHRQWFIVVVACLSLERSFSFLTFPCQVERGVRILKKENVQKKKKL